MDEFLILFDCDKHFKAYCSYNFRKSYKQYMIKDQLFTQVIQEYISQDSNTLFINGNFQK
jgi:hypothetical protein